MGQEGQYKTEIDELIKIHALFKSCNVVGCIRAGAVRLSERCGPLAVGSGERWVNRMETIMVEGVVDGGLLSVRRGDRYLLEGDDLVRRHSVRSPVPVWVPEVGRSLNPCIFIRGGIRGCDSRSMPLDDLL